MGNPYSADKGTWYGGRIEAIRDGGHPSPVHVQLILSDLCNQSCHFCAYRMPGYTSSELFAGNDRQVRFPINPDRQIETAKALEIVEDCRRIGVKAVQLTGGGEPSIHPGIVEVIDDIVGARMEWAIVSNGYSWSDELFERVPSASWVRISVDAGRPETYAEVRQTPRTAFDRVLGNITRMRQEIDAADAETTLGFGFVVTPENWREAYEAARLAKNAGAHNIRYSAMFSDEGVAPFLSIGKDVQALISDAKHDLEDSEFQVVGRFSLAVGNLRMATPDYERCAYQRFTTYIGGDLNVYVCCVYAYNSHGLVGSIRDRSFAEFWASDETRQFFADFDARTCERCQFNDRNRALNGAIDAPKPQHVEFV